MKALVYTDKSGLVVKEVPTPEAAPGRIRMKIKNCGICGSDLFFVNSGGLRDGTIIGHEFSGIVDQVGLGVSGISVGDRVIARPTGCGQCRNCAAGMENICPERKSIGLGNTPGGFAEYLVVDQDMVIPVPENLGLDQASMADQLGSALHGIRICDFKAGEKVLVTGAGPIGLCAVMLLKYLGASKVVVSEMVEKRAGLAMNFGADAVVSPGKKSLSSHIDDHFGKEGPDCIIECTGAPGGLLDVIQCSRVGCRISLVGMCMQPVSILPFAIFQKHLSIFGSFGNTQKECIECMNIMASGKIPSEKLITKKVPIDGLPHEFATIKKDLDQLKVMMEID